MRKTVNKRIFSRFYAFSLALRPVLERKKPLYSLVLFSTFALVAIGCGKSNDEQPTDRFEERTGKVWDTTLAATLGRAGGRASLEVIDPIYLDTNWDGKLNIQGGKQVSFDINGDGIADVVHEWNELDAQLVFDADNNGKVDNGKEIMNETSVSGEQNAYRNGWEKARAVFDANGDDLINGAELDRVKIWTDSNGNGVVDPGELKSAKDSGLQSIDTKKEEFVMKVKV